MKGNAGQFPTASLVCHNVMAALGLLENREIFQNE
jgi:hypothetical protein